MNDTQPALEYLAPYNLPTPEVLLILGSGLGSIADTIDSSQVISTKNIPGYPVSTVPGHKGRLVFGQLEGKHVMVVQGRIHVYEGYTPYEAAFPVRLAAALGARKFIVTNAAGGIHPDFSPGTLMLISNHINMAMEPPPIPHPGPPAVSPYDTAWINQILDLTRDQISLQKGVYLWTKGPAYETKSEIKAFAALGADAVGMSTVPEVSQAHTLGLKTLGISTITNHAAGLSPILLKHEDVLEVGKGIQTTLESLVRLILRET
ncbi:MAG: purine-nucleoside phosphorylase [Rhodothermaceae bacterium]|nr:purine-nucleoside phosphorylase [Rhodothermaceae bacterium]